MKPDTPILMLSLLIPVTADTSPEQVINIIGAQVYEALQQIRAQQEAPDPEAIPEEEFRATVTQETLESYTETTKPDLLAQLGYTAEV